MKERATQWDQPVSEYVQLAERYLGFQQPGSVYGFADAGHGHKRVIPILDSVFKFGRFPIVFGCPEYLPRQAILEMVICGYLGLSIQR